MGSHDVVPVLSGLYYPPITLQGPAGGHVSAVINPVLATDRKRSGA